MKVTESAGRWETNRGDEWWYTDSFIEADAMFNVAPPALVIVALKSLGPSLSADRFYSFLRHSQSQFPDAQIRIVLGSSTRSLVETLSSSGRIQRELVKNPYSVEARILSWATSTP